MEQSLSEGRCSGRRGTAQQPLLLMHTYHTLLPPSIFYFQIDLLEVKRSRNLSQ